MLGFWWLLVDIPGLMIYSLSAFVFWDFAFFSSSSLSRAETGGTSLHPVRHFALETIPSEPASSTIFGSLLLSCALDFIFPGRLKGWQSWCLDFIFDLWSPLPLPHFQQLCCFPHPCPPASNHTMSAPSEEEGERKKNPGT